MTNNKPYVLLIEQNDGTNKKLFFNTAEQRRAAYQALFFRRMMSCN